jgi:tRNA modification GTPase
VIEEDILLSGRRWKLVDTAGVRTGEHAAEVEGIALGMEFLSAASFWILVVDGTRGLQDRDRELLREFQKKPHLVVWNKQDLPSWKSVPRETLNSIGVSAHSGEGIEGVFEELRKFGDRTEDGLTLPTDAEASRLRLVLRSVESLLGLLAKGAPTEVLAEENRQIVTSLEAVIGSVSTEQVLDRVFGEFCIGK